MMLAKCCSNFIVVLRMCEAPVLASTEDRQGYGQVVGR